ncbi:cache domain-containing sensor histidine kinase [Paenibacillus whitsoniae]|uniref:histidine kinase n=1 Tax=Paenibacillus whitsoniae TaxID=2496558 RepID=A0A3S0AB29_9BACL|nr:sensor histidine kinase [Paenibacillus whitsoniae]RTE08792.1 sensor histidine kinase [Paenibacillus whitsoniae]
MSQWIGKLSALYYNINLRTKLVISYLILIIIPVVVLVYFSYSTIHKSVVEQTGKAYLETLKQAEKNIAFGIESAYNIANLAQSNYDVQQILRTVSERPLTSAEVIDFFNLLNRNVNNYVGINNVLKVSYYMKGNPAFVAANPNFFGVDQLQLEAGLQPLLAGEKKEAWFYGGEGRQLSLVQPDEVVFIKEIKDINRFQSVLGYIMVELDAKFIWNILNDIQLPAGAEKVVMSPDGRIGIHQLTTNSTSLSDLYIKSPPSNEEGIVSFGPGSGSNYAAYSKVSGLNWQIALLMTKKHLGMNSRWIQNFMLALAGVVSIIAIITAFFISGSITKRLKKLVQLIKRAEMGSFETENNIRGNDEYARLQRSFNKMSRQIKALIEEVYQAQISKQETEMKLLYAQINPHFLYNTLDIIHWSALRIEAKEIAEVTEALAKFLRLSLNEGKEHIRVAEEVLEVSKYMEIINVRYRGAIQVITEIEEGIEEFPIIKMILQPLVENAVVHGIRPKPGKAGTIRIRAYREESYLLFEVVDDGVGIAEDKLQRLFEMETRGYGVKNVHQRIQVYYGKDCGLYFDSKPGLGCRAVARLKVTAKSLESV